MSTKAKAAKTAVTVFDCLPKVNVGRPLKLPIIDGREAVPVRLLPFATGWLPLSPDSIAALFSQFHPMHSWPLATHRLNSDGSHDQLLSRDWDGVRDRISELEAALEQRDAPDGEWEAQSVLLLPARVFVWRDELELAYSEQFGPERADYGVPRPGLPALSEEQQQAELQHLIDLCNRPEDDEQARKEIERIESRAAATFHTREGDGELRFDPLLTEEQERVAFEGFTKAAEPVSGLPIPAPTALKKSALVKKWIDRWPKIEQHIKDGRTNGLAAAMIEGKFGWYDETVAVEWARQRNHLSEHGLSELARTVYRMPR